MIVQYLFHEQDRGIRKLLLSTMTSDFLKMKEEFEAELLEGDLDIELSDSSSNDNYGDDFEVTTPLNSKKGDDAQFFSNIEKELQKGLKRLDTGQRQSFKHEIEDYHANAKREKERRNTAREIESKKVLDKLNKKNNNNKTPPRPSPPPHPPPQRSTITLENNNKKEILGDDKSVETPPPKTPTTVDTSLDNDKTIQWSMKQLQKVPIANINNNAGSEKNNVDTLGELKGLINNTSNGTYRNTAKTSSSSSSSRMSFSINPDFINKPKSNKAKMKYLRSRQSKLSHELHRAFRSNDLSLADRINRKLVKINNELIKYSGKIQEIVTNVTLADQSYKLPAKQSIRHLTANKPMVPTVLSSRRDHSNKIEINRIMKPINWYVEAKATSPLFKKQNHRPNFETTNDQNTKNDHDHYLNNTYQQSPSNLKVKSLSNIKNHEEITRKEEWLKEVKNDSWNIVNNLREELKEARLNDTGNQIDIINGAQYKRLVKNYNQSYSYVKGALDIYLDKEAQRLAVEPKILNEVQTLIRLTARDMGIDYNTVMKKKRRPQSAMPLSRSKTGFETITLASTHKKSRRPRTAMIKSSNRRIISSAGRKNSNRTYGRSSSAKSRRKYIHSAGARKKDFSRSSVGNKKMNRSRPRSAHVTRLRKKVESSNRLYFTGSNDSIGTDDSSIMY